MLPQRSRGGSTPARCLMVVTRDMVHDAKLRLRGNLATLLRRVVSPTLRARALELQPVRDALAPTSELHGKPSFTVVPLAAGAAGGKGGADATAAASLVKVNKKTKAAAEAEIGAAKLPELFCDGDWVLDELLGEWVDAAVKPALEPRLADVDARLDKLLAKLGLDGGSGNAAAGGPATGDV